MDLPEADESNNPNNNPNNNPLVSSDALGEYTGDDDDEDFYIPATASTIAQEEDDPDEESGSVSSGEDEVIPTVTTTRSGRVSRPRRRLIEELDGDVGLLSSFIPRGLINEVGLAAITAEEPRVSVMTKISNKSLMLLICYSKILTRMNLILKSSVCLQAVCYSLNVQLWQRKNIFFL